MLGLTSQTTQDGGQCSRFATTGWPGYQYHTMGTTNYLIDYLHIFRIKSLIDQGRLGHGFYLKCVIQDFLHAGSAYWKHEILFLRLLNLALKTAILGQTAYRNIHIRNNFITEQLKSYEHAYLTSCVVAADHLPETIP